MNVCLSLGLSTLPLARKQIDFRFDNFSENYYFLTSNLSYHNLLILKESKYHHMFDLGTISQDFRYQHCEGL